MSPNQKRLLNILAFLVVALITLFIFGCGINLAAPQHEQKLGEIHFWNRASTASVILIEGTTKSVPYVCPVMEFPTLVVYIEDGLTQYYMADCIAPDGTLKRYIRAESMHLWIYMDDGQCFEVDVTDSGWTDLTVVVRDDMAEVYDVQF